MEQKETMKQAVKSIQNISRAGSLLGLSRVIKLMKLLGNPQDKLKFVHIAGSNGKGSTAAMIASVLKAAGFKTGLYTSPHLIRYNERICIDGIEISDADYKQAAEKVCAAASEMEDAPTEFEIITAMAMLFFYENGCDIAVLETGLGGRLDATNVITAPEVCVITNIGIEHTEYLGDTLEQIASEKAGIFKDGCNAVVYPVSEAVTDVYKNRLSMLKDTTLEVVDFDDIKVRDNEPAVKTKSRRQFFDWKNIKGLQIKLLGKHQLKNAAVALQALSALKERGFDISEEAVRKGLEEAYWPARLEIVRNKPLFIIDGAHNPQCAEALAESLKELLEGKKAVFVFGALAGKHFEQTIDIVKPFAKEFICLTPESDRALPGKDVAEYIKSQGIRAEAYESADDGITAALKAAGDDGAVVSFGSLYMAGFVRESFFRIYRKGLRKKGIEARKGMTEEKRKEYSEAIVKNIAESEEFAEAKNILIYCAVGAEADIGGIVDMPGAEEKHFAYPVCLDKTTMEARVPDSAVEYNFGKKGDDACWNTGKYNIPEPAIETSRIMRPEEIDLVICPCAAFDENGSRLGMGSGYYDRYLPECKNAVITAAAFDAQKVYEIPAEPWDVPVAKVFTEIM